jgi:lipopolysaccharide exporter
MPGVRTIVSGNSLGSRTLKGTLWLGFGKTYTQLLLLAKAVILGRLLGPEEFGLVGVALLAVMFLNTFTNTGFGSALVQHPDPQERDIITAWWVLLGRGILITIILWVFSPWIAAIFHEPRATPILRAFGGVQLLSALTSIGIILLAKELDFRSGVKIEAWGTTLEMVVAVVFAFWHRNVWALVWGAYAGVITRLILSYIVCPVFPRFIFDLKSGLEFFKFGQWVLLTSMMLFVFTKAADAMSGIMFGAAALGLYQMAGRFGLITTNHVGDLFFNAFFPAYSLIQNDAAKLKLTYLKVLQVSSFVLFPLTAVIILAVAPLLPFLLGAQWAGVVELVPGVALGGLIQALLRTGTPLFLATGKPRLQFSMDAVSALGIVIFIYPLGKYYGLQGLSWSYAAGMSLALPIWWRYVKMQSKLSNREIATSILPTVFASMMLSLAIIIPYYVLLVSYSHWEMIMGLATSVCIGIVLFIAVALSMRRILNSYNPIYDTINLVKNSFTKKNSQIHETM